MWKCPFQSYLDLKVLMKVVDWKLEKKLNCNHDFNRWCIQRRLEQICWWLIQDWLCWQHPSIQGDLMGFWAHLVLQSYSQKCNEAHLGVKTQTNNFWINRLILQYSRQFNSHGERSCPALTSERWSMGCLVCKTIMLTKFAHFQVVRILDVNMAR